MSVRTKRLARALGTVATATIYTCPAGVTAIIKYVTFFNGNLVAASNVVLRSVMAGTTIVWLAETVPAGGSRRESVYVVLEPGDTLRLDTSQAGNPVSIHGVELVGVAP